MFQSYRWSLIGLVITSCIAGHPSGLSVSTSTTAGSPPPAAPSPVRPAPTATGPTATIPVPYPVSSSVPPLPDWPLHIPGVPSVIGTSIPAPTAPDVATPIPVPLFSPTPGAYPTAAPSTQSPTPVPTSQPSSQPQSPSPNPSPTPKPTPSPAATPDQSPTGVVNLLNLPAQATDSELGDWQEPVGPDWLHRAAWFVTDGVWRMPTFSGPRYAMRQYAGTTYGAAGTLPTLYEVTFRVRPAAAEGRITVIPYFVDATHYCMVQLDLANQNVSLWEFTGGTPTSGSQGTVDLSQAHRGWRPLPSPDADGAYTIRTRVNGAWHSLAVWVGSTWIDTPKVDSVDDRVHGVAIRTSGHAQDILAVTAERYTSPYQAR